MPIDYNNTTNWNDPYNSWVKFNQVSLSAAEVDLQTFTLTSFNPLGSGVVARYQTTTGTYYLDFDVNATVYGLSGWVLYDVVNVDTLYAQASALRATPTKSTGVASGWAAGGSGSDPALLYINPIAGNRTKWEKRRKRLLGYI